MILDLQCQDNLPQYVDATAPLTGLDAQDTLAAATVDSDTPEAKVIVFGRRSDGQSVCVTLKGYRPWIRLVYKKPFVTEVAVPVAAGPGSPKSPAKTPLQKLCDKVKGTVIDVLRADYNDVQVVAESLPKFYGFVSDGTGKPMHYACCKVYLPTFAAAFKVESMWRWTSSSKYAAFLDDWEPSEMQTPNTVRCLNELGIEPSGWCTLDKFLHSGIRISTCNAEVTADVKDLRGRPDMTAVAPLKILSFDAEMYSHNNDFPEVIHGDHVIAICASIKVYGTPELERHAFVLWDAESQGLLDCKTPNMITHYCESPEDLFDQFRDLVVVADPDILTGWNIYGFDMPFLWDGYVAAYEAPKTRGSEALHLDLLKALQRPTPSVGTLLQGLHKSSASDSGPKKAIAALSLRHKMALRKSAELPEVIAGPLRREIRSALAMPAEPNFTGAADLETLRALPAGRTKDLFQQVIDQGRQTGLARGRYLSRLACEKSSLAEKRMASAAKGDNTYYYWSGRCCTDLMQIIKDDKKLDDNTLKFAAQTFLDSEYGKLDMTPAEIFKAYRTQEAPAMAAMLDYCARDADIPVLLMDRLSYVPLWVEMSRVTFTGLQQVLNGGQQRKVYNLIARFVHNTHILNKADSEWPMSTVNEDDDHDNDELGTLEDAMKKRRPDYQGATVIEPISGFYTESISTLDFESLYPSIIIHFNLCPSVYVRPSTIELVRTDTQVAIESHKIRHAILVDADKDQYDEFDREYFFVKNVQGVVPRLLQHLLKARKVAKKAMNNAPDEFERNVQNGRQLALKVSCNSVYGFFGVPQKKGLMSCKPVAAVTTLRGRAFIEAAKNYVEAHYTDSKVLYGDTDSIMINWGPSIDVPKAYQLAEEASAAITELLRSGAVEGASKPLLASAASAVTLANEKVYTPYLLIQKKNYAGFKYLLLGGHKPETLDDFEGSIDMKGIDAVRRDRSKLVKTLSNAVLDALLVQKSLQAAIGTLKSALADVAQQKAPLDWFVLSKSLKGTYANENAPHVQAWRRMAARGDPDVPEVGTRMPFVIVAAKGAYQHAKALYERSEHPDYVKRAGLHYCAKYYLSNGQDVIERLLGPTGLGDVVKQLFTDAMVVAEHKSSGNMSLMSFMKRSRGEAGIV